MAANQPEILDLDKLVPKKRIVKLAGKEIDVSKIPSEVTLEIAGKRDVLNSGSNESFELVFEIIIKVCNAANPDEKVTKSWLVQNTTMDQLLALMEFIMKPLQDRADATGKNKARPNNKK